jgi:hypothetical protein
MVAPVLLHLPNASCPAGTAELRPSTSIADLDAICEALNVVRTRERPNGMPFSCRERAAEKVSKFNDLARQAVSYNELFGISHYLPACEKNTITARWALQSRRCLASAQLLVGLLHWRV